MTRTHRKIDDGDPDIPGEAQKVQVNAADLAAQVQTALVRLVDTVLSHETTNQDATATIIVDGMELASQVPVTALLWLEKQLVDWGTFINKLPVLDPARDWDYNALSGHYQTPVTTTTRTKKVPRHQVLVPATDKHPAQVRQWDEDVIAGYWDKVEYSGALPTTVVRELQVRVRKLTEAVKVARQGANAIEVRQVDPGAALVGYVFDPVIRPGAHT